MNNLLLVIHHRSLCIVLTCVALLCFAALLFLLVLLLPFCYLLTAHNLIQHVSLRHRHPGEVAPLKAGRRLPIITRRHRSLRLLVYGFLPIGLLTTRFNPYRPAFLLYPTVLIASGARRSRWVIIL